MTRRMTAAPTQLTREVMLTPAVTVTPRMTLGELAKLFEHHPEVDAFPVVTEDGILLGIVSRLDILRAVRPGAALARPDPRDVLAAPVSAVMRHGVVSVEPGDPAFAAADLMVETRFQSLPVVRRDGGRPILVGIITRQGLMQAILSAAAS